MNFTGLPIETVAWIGAFVAVFVTVLYLVKLRRRRVEVPFSPLWERAVGQPGAETNWRRRLKRLLSWVLHLVVGALLVAAALGPQLHEDAVEQRHVLVLVDSSASMAATDVTGGHNRFEVARNEANEVLDTIGGDDRVMVALFDDGVQPLGPFVEDPSLARAELNERHLSAGAADIEGALQFAADSLQGRTPAELVLISDGAGLDEHNPPQVEFDEGVTVRHRKVGESSDNLAITAFEARRYPANRLDHEVFVQVQSYFDRPVEATLELSADGRLIDTRPLSLRPGGVHRQFYPGQAATGERIEARVRVDSDDARDVFGLDDTAYATIQPPPPMEVQLVTEGNLYLEGSLLLGSHIDTEVVSPGDYDPEADFDVTIFDGVGAEPPREGDVLYFDPPPEQSPFAIVDEHADPIITDVARGHPLVERVELTDLNIARTSSFDTGGEDTVVAESFGHPVIVARDGGERKAVAVGFDVRDSDFVLRVGFPVFLLNTLDYFAGDDGDGIHSFSTGETWSIPVGAGVDTAEIVDPRDERHTAAVHDRRALFFGETPGFHRLVTGEGTTTVAANLADPQESDITPRRLQLETTEVTEQFEPPSFERRRLWLVLLVVAALLLVVEWFTYNRRWTV